MGYTPNNRFDLFPSDESLKKKRILAQQLKNDIIKIIKIIDELHYKYKKPNRFKWKTVYTGYGYRTMIVDMKNKWSKKYIVVYNIEESSDYFHLIENNDERIFQAIQEINLFIEEKLDTLKRNLNDFNSVYKDHALIIQDNIKAYKELVNEK
jgi:hypothetical protein